jgi:hypothetical protein
MSEGGGEGEGEGEELAEFVFTEPTEEELLV